MRRSTKLTMITTALLTAAPVSAFGQQGALVTDRPDFTESSATITPGRVQLEAGYTFSRGGETRRHGLGELLTRIGLVERLELRAGLNSFVISDGPEEDREGFEDLLVGAKLRLAEPGGPGRWRPAVSLLARTFIPTGARGIGGNELAPELKLILGWEVSPRLAVGANLNVASVETEGDRFAQFSGSVSLGASVARRVGAFAEAFGFVAGNPLGADVGFLNGGVTLQASDDFQFDGRLGVGFGDEEPNYFTGLGFALRI